MLVSSSASAEVYKRQGLLRQDGTAPPLTSVETKLADVYASQFTVLGEFDANNLALYGSAAQTSIELSSTVATAGRVALVPLANSCATTTVGAIGANATATLTQCANDLTSILASMNASQLAMNVVAVPSATLSTAATTFDAYADIVGTGGNGAYGAFVALRTYLATKQGAARPVGNYPAELAPLANATFLDVMSYVGTAL